MTTRYDVLDADSISRMGDSTVAASSRGYRADSGK